jgi:hypothetical protein
MKKITKEFSEFSDQEDFIKEWFKECGRYPPKDILEVRKIGLRRLNRVGNKNSKPKTFSKENYKKVDIEKV